MSNTNSKDGTHSEVLAFHLQSGDDQHEESRDDSGFRPKRLQCALAGDPVYLKVRDAEAAQAPREIYQRGYLALEG